MHIVRGLAILVLGLFAGSLVFQARAAFGDGAAIKVGYVDIEQVFLAHPKAEKYRKELEEFVRRREVDLQEKGEKETQSDEDRQRLQLLAARYQEEISEKDKELTSQLLEEIKKAVAEVAKEKNLPLVLDEKAVLHGGENLTSEVIKRLKP